MKRAAILAAIALAACEADLPMLTDAKGGFDAKCTGPYADMLVDTFPTDLQNATAALGPPDMMSVTLTTDALVTVGFIGLGGISDMNGTDLKVHATVDSSGHAVVRVAQADQVFRYSGDITMSNNEVDIQVADFSSVNYVRLVGVSGTVQIDAIQATHDMCR